MDAPPLGRMDPYGFEHWGVLLLLVVAATLLIRWVRRSERPQVDRVLRTAGWVLLANSVFWTAWGFMPWAWNLEESLPLHFSDALRFLVPIALITRARWATAIVFYWGLTLNLMSVVTPNLNYFVSPPLEFIQYWVAHGAALLVPMILVGGRGFRPTWRDYGTACAATLAWALVAFSGNLLTGANYAYLNRAPQSPTILDLLGPWPQYLLIEALLITGFWALVMTMPWALRDRTRAHRGQRRGGPDRRPAGPAAAPDQASSSTCASRTGP